MERASDVVSGVSSAPAQGGTWTGCLQAAVSLPKWLRLRVLPCAGKNDTPLNTYEVLSTGLHSHLHYASSWLLMSAMRLEPMRIFACSGSLMVMHDGDA